MKKFLCALLTLMLVLGMQSADAYVPYIGLGGVPMSGVWQHVNDPWADHIGPPTDGSGYAYTSGDWQTLYLVNYENQGRTEPGKFEETALTFAEWYLSLDLTGNNTLDAPHTMHLEYGGDLEISAQSTGTLNLKGLYGIYNDHLYANGFTIHGGTVNIDGTEGGIFAQKVTLNNGTLNISTPGDGVIVDSLTVNGGTLNLHVGGKGMVAKKIIINDGTMNITSDTQCISASEELVINGGAVRFDNGSSNDFLAVAPSITCSVPMSEGLVVDDHPDDSSLMVLDLQSVIDAGSRPVKPDRSAWLGAPPPAVPAAPEAVPATGDDAAVSLWGVMVVLSAAGLWLLNRRRKGFGV